MVKCAFSLNDDHEHEVGHLQNRNTKSKLIKQLRSWTVGTRSLEPCGAKYYMEYIYMYNEIENNYILVYSITFGTFYS